MKIQFVIILLTLNTLVFSQNLKTPLEDNNFLKLTSYAELSTFIHQLDNQSEILTVDEIGKSVEGRSLFRMYYSTSGFGKDPNKIKVLIFAQQHGNEQSGKEGALLLAGKLLLPENRYLFDKIDLVIIPQVNPDGSEVNKRRNGHAMDLNRNHLILTEPETQAIQELFGQYLFEATLDVHEYYPYDSAWEIKGFRKNAEITIGGTTNINIAKKIRNLTNKEAIPYLKKYLNDRNFSAFEYCPGGPPETDYLRKSTFDINDGRQSLGIQNTFSFIQEGRNGTDGYIENIERRARGQMTGMLGFLEFIYQNHKIIKKTVGKERLKLMNPPAHEKIAIQMQHVANGDKLRLPVYSYISGKDSVIIVSNYKPEVRSLLNVEKPLGYLVPANQTQLLEWIEREQLKSEPCQATKSQLKWQYFIKSVDSVDFEGDKVINPIIEINQVTADDFDNLWIFIPTAQLKGNTIVLALEPQSMLGLSTYPMFSGLIKPGEVYPVLKVTKK